MFEYKLCDGIFLANLGKEEVHETIPYDKFTAALNARQQHQRPPRFGFCSHRTLFGVAVFEFHEAKPRGDELCHCSLLV